MAESLSRPSTIRFGGFEVGLRAGELRKQGVKVRLQEQPFQILVMLLQRPGEVVTREEIQKNLWRGDTFVDFEHSLATAVRKLREALGDSADNPRFVETLPRRGYRFIAPVEALTPGPPPAGREWARETGSGEGAAAPVSPTAVVGAGLARPWEGRALPYKLVSLAAAAAVVIVAALVALNVAGLRERLLRTVGAVREPPLQIHSIAVLPLENLSRDPDQEYFADGMTDELISTLAKIGSLRVISRTSVMRYKGTKKPLPEIAQELNVDGIVEGSVLRSGNRVRITANLLHGPTDRHLWTDSYESDLGDVLILQGEVARSIANEVRIKVTPEEQARLTATRAVNPEAFRLYLQGRYQWSKTTPAANEKSITLFQQALEIDPNSALAWAGLAQSYGTDAVEFSTAPKEWFAKAKAAALKALEIDNSLGEAHTALGFIHYSWDWDWPAAERELNDAVELKPGDAYARFTHADFLRYMGRYEEAIAEIRRAQELDPISPLTLNWAAHIYRDAHRYDESIEQIRKALDLDPNFGGAHGAFGLTYLAKGMAKEAATEFETAERLGMGRGLDIEALVYAADGRRGEARKLVARVEEHARRKEMTPFAVAQFYVGLGDKAKALDWLEKAYEQHDPYMATLKVNVFFDPLRSDPRFQALLRRMKFPS